MLIVTKGYGPESSGATGGDFDGKVIQLEFSVNTISNVFTENIVSKTFGVQTNTQSFERKVVPLVFGVSRISQEFYLNVNKEQFCKG